MECRLQYHFFQKDRGGGNIVVDERMDLTLGTVFCCPRWVSLLGAGYCLCQKVVEDPGPGQEQVQVHSSHLEQVEALRMGRDQRSCLELFEVGKAALELVEVVEEDLDLIPDRHQDMDPM